MTAIAPAVLIIKKSYFVAFAGSGPAYLSLFDFWSLNIKRLNSEVEYPANIRA